MSADNEDLQRVAALLRDADEAAGAGDASAAADARARAAAALDVLGMTRAVFDEEASMWRFGYARPGPAGTVTVHLGGGNGVTFDLADPSRLLSLFLSSADAATAVVIADGVLGAGAARFVRDGAEASALVAFERAGTPALQALSRLALLDRARHMSEEQDGVWALWAAEAAVLSLRAADAVPSLRARAHAEAITAAPTVAEVSGSQLDAAAHRRLVELLPDLARLAPAEPERSLWAQAERRLSESTGQDDGRWRERVRRGLRAVRSVMPGPLRPRWAEVTLAPGPQGEPRRARFPVDAAFEDYGLSTRSDATLDYHVDSGELEFRCEIDAVADRLGELWLRAFTEPERLVLDSAPLALNQTASPPVAAAQLVLPPEMRVEELGFDITASPAQPIEGSRLWHVSEALRISWHATLALRTGLYADAADLWRSCAELWAAAGEDLQAQEARADAERVTIRSVGGDPGDGETPRPFLGEMRPAG